MFCFSMYAENNGSAKPSHEQELLKMVYKKKKSTSACEKAAVYGDVSADLRGFPVQKLEDGERDFLFTKRKHAGTWIDASLHKQV